MRMRVNENAEDMALFRKWWDAAHWQNLYLIWERCKIEKSRNQGLSLEINIIKIFYINVKKKHFWKKIAKASFAQMTTPMKKGVEEGNEEEENEEEWENKEEEGKKKEERRRKRSKRGAEAVVMVLRQGPSTGWNGVGSVSCGVPSCLQGPSSRRWRQHL